MAPPAPDRKLGPARRVPEPALRIARARRSDGGRTHDDDCNSERVRGWSSTWPRRQRLGPRTRGSLSWASGVLEGCGKGAKEENTRSAAGAQARKQARMPPTAKEARIGPEAEPRRKRRHRRTTWIDKIFCSVQAGAQAMQLIRPDGESADLDRIVEELIDVCVEHPHVRSVELQVREIFRHLLSAKTEAIIGQKTPCGALGEGLHWQPLCASCARAIACSHGQDSLVIW